MCNDNHVLCHTWLLQWCLTALSVPPVYKDTCRSLINPNEFRITVEIIQPVHFNYSDVTWHCYENTDNFFVRATACSGVHQRNYQSHPLLDLCEGKPPATGRLPSHRASYAENVSISCLTKRPWLNMQQTDYRCGWRNVHSGNWLMIDILPIAGENIYMFHLFKTASLRWRHNECDGVSNHQPRERLLNRLSRRWSKKTSKLRVTGLCGGEYPDDRWIPRTTGQ